MMPISSPGIRKAVIENDKGISTGSPQQIGTYPVNLDLHKEVKHEIKVKVVAE